MKPQHTLVPITTCKVCSGCHSIIMVHNGPDTDCVDLEIFGLKYFRGLPGP